MTKAEIKKVKQYSVRTLKYDVLTAMYTEDHRWYEIYNLWHDLQNYKDNDEPFSLIDNSGYTHYIDPKHIIGISEVKK